MCNLATTAPDVIALPAPPPKVNSDQMVSLTLVLETYNQEGH